MKLWVFLLLILISCNNSDSASGSTDSTDGTEVDDTVPVVQGTLPPVKALDSLGGDTLLNKPR